MEKPVDRFGIKLSFAGTPDFFKLGLPFEAVVGIVNLDSVLSFKSSLCHCIGKSCLVL